MRSLALLACALGSVLTASCDDDTSEGAPPADTGILDWDAEAIPPVDVSPGITDGGAAGDVEPPPLGGYDAGTCTGVVSPCSSLAGATCSTVMGCKQVGKCTGYASSCSTRYSSYSCTSQSGCYWSSYSGECSGFAWSCSSFNSSGACIYQDGCRWNLNCEGVATSCSELSPSECRLQPGCSLR